MSAQPLILILCVSAAVACLSSGASSCCCGGCRHHARARGVKTAKSSLLTADVSYPKESGLSAWTRMDNNSYQDPNSLFLRCCQDRQLPRGCWNKCNFQAYTKSMLQNMLLGMESCPLRASAEMQFCAAQGRDHRQCCYNAGVGSTTAGNKCLVFCDQRPDRFTQIGLSHVPCYEKFEQMKQCFQHNIFQEIMRKRHNAKNTMINFI